MSRIETASLEATYLTVLRGLVYGAAVALFVAPLDALAARIAALLAVPLALGLTRLPSVHRMRGTVLAAAAAGIVILGVAAGWAIGHVPGFASLIGFRTAIALGGAATFGATTFGVIFGLRMLAIRRRAFSVLEAGVVILIVVAMFAGHRDHHVGQPRYFADWSYSRGFDPGLVLLAVGVAALGSIALLLLQNMRLRQATAALVILLLLGAGGFYLLWKFFPEVSATPPPPPAKQPPPQGPSGSDPAYDYPNMGPKPQGARRPVAIVTFQDEYNPPQGYFYFREKAFSELRFNRLAHPKQGGNDTDVPASFPDKPVAVPNKSGSANFVKVPAIISLLEPHERPFGLVAVQSMEPRPNPNPKKFVRSYATVSLAPTIAFPGDRSLKCRAGDPSWSASVRGKYLETPNDPRYRKLADEIIAASGIPPHLKPEYQTTFYALALKEWLEKNIIYTKSSPELNEHVNAADPTASFLFGNRHGYCTHIAQALTILLRAKGIPARMAGGYAAEASRRGQGSALLLQNSDGHAWCEIYLQDVGWTVLDVAVERSKDPPPPPPDADQQRHLGNENRKQVLPPELQPESDPGERRTTAWLVSLLIPLLFVVLALYGIKAWRRLAPRLASHRSAYRLSYRSALDRLAEVGLHRQFGETREEFAQRVARWAPEFADMTAAHVKAAISGEHSEPKRSWLDRQAQLVRRIAATFPRYRRWLGLANPIAWLWTR